MAADVTVHTDGVQVEVTPDDPAGAFARGGSALRQDPSAILRECPYMTRAEVHDRSGVPEQVARQFWRALGFVEVAGDERAFTETDALTLALAYEPIQNGQVSAETAMSLARAVGRSTERMASWQLQALVDNLDDQQLTPEMLLGMAQFLADHIEPALTNVWRRHLMTHVHHYMACHGVDGDHERTDYVVGFADLANFTRISQECSERQLGRLVQRFEATASDIVTAHAGRVVKTVGDAVLFVVHSIPDAAELALELLEEITATGGVSDLKIGLASGPVVECLGDVYGTTVNFASRMCSLAYPGSVLVDKVVAAALADHPDLAVTSLGRRKARGLGWVNPWLLTRRATRRTETAEPCRREPHPRPA